MPRPCRCIFVVGTSLVLASGAPPALGQSVDVGPAHLRTGHALDISVRVRTEGAGATPLPKHCIQAEWVADGRLWTSADTRVLTSADPDPEWTRVRLQHRHRLLDTQAEVRLVLRCGPTYERHFTVSSRSAPTLLSAHPPGAPFKTRSMAKGGPAQDLEARDRPSAHSTARAASAPTAATLAEVPPIDGPSRGTTTHPARLSEAETASVPGMRNVQALVPSTAPSTQTRPEAVPPPRPVPQVPIDAITPAQANDAARLLQAFERLQSEHQKTLAKMGVLRARLVHQERSPSTTTWAVLGGLLILTLGQFGRSSAGDGSRWPQQRSPQRADKPRRFRLQWPRSGDHTHGKAPPTDPALATEPAPHPVMPIRDVTSGPVEDRIPVKPESKEDPWRHADFGSASLELAGVEDTLSEVQRLVADGYPAAATITIEQALMQQPGKHPALLLALLDLYEEMGQPWNRERVVAQLEALYNVDAGELSSASIPNAGDGLEACRDSLDRIQRTWHGAEAAAAIASLLGRPAAVEVLTLSAFREAVWLFRLSSSHRPAETAAVELTLEPLSLG